MKSLRLSPFDFNINYNVTLIFIIFLDIVDDERGDGQYGPIDCYFSYGSLGSLPETRTKYAHQRARMAQNVPICRNITGK